MKNKKLIYTIILATVLFISVVGATYAYFAINQNNNSNETRISTGRTILVLEDVNPITQEDQISPNNLTITRYLTIRNEGSVNGYAKLLFKNLINTFVTDSLVYKLEEVDSNKEYISEVQEETVVPKSDSASNTELADGLLIPANSSKYYKLTITYLYSDTVNQDADLNKVMTCGFTIEEGMSSFKDDVNLVAYTLKGNKTNSSYSELMNDFKDYKYDATVTCTNGSVTKMQRNGTITINNAEPNTKCSIDFFEPNYNISCVNLYDEEIDCPALFKQGDRIKIGSEYFRYLRTTDTSKQLAECGGAGITGDNGYEYASKACADSANGVHRFLAEYNLKRTGSYSTGTAIAADALQDVNDESTNTAVYYGGNNSNYSDSYVKAYLKDYENTLNTLAGGDNPITVNLMTISEIKSFNWGCPASSYGICSSIPTWASNSYYWLGSPYSSSSVWYIASNNYLKYESCAYKIAGVRPVISVPSSIVLNKKSVTGSSYIEQGYRKVYELNTPRTFATSDKEDTGWTPDFDKDFVIEGDYNYGSSSGRALLIGNYGNSHELNLEFYTSNYIRVFFRDGEYQSNTIPRNTDFHLKFKWDSKSQKFLLAVSWGDGQNVILKKVHEYHGKSGGTMKINQDDRGSNDFTSPLTVNSLVIYEK